MLGRLRSFWGSFSFDVVEVFDGHTRVGPSVHPLMARAAERDLLSVDSGEHFVERTQFNVDCFDMLQVMHFHVLCRTAVRTGLA